jgi:hypothetical protein
MRAPKAENVPTYIMLPAALREKVEELAAADGRSLSNFLSRLIEAGVARRAGRGVRAKAPFENSGRAEHAVPAA